MREDVGMGLFGVADPARAGGGEDGGFGRRGWVGFVVREGLWKGLEDFVCAEDEGCFAHGIGVDYPCEAVAVSSS